jgi:hypothetical protein
LDRVHAKLLICDGNTASIGSQNFTTYARKSREVTVFLGALSSSELMQVVQEWLDSAELVSQELLAQLMGEIEVQLRSAEIAEAELQRSVSQIRQNFVPPKTQFFNAWKRALPEHMAELIDHEEVDNLQVAKRAWIAKVPGQYYESLMTESDFTWWYYGPGEYELLKRLYLYPILFSDTGILGFARLSQSRITYIRSGFLGSNSFRLGKSNVEFDVEFPNNDNRTANVQLTIRQKNARRREVTVDLIFDGVGFTYVEDNIDQLVDREQRYMRPDNEGALAFGIDASLLSTDADLLHAVFASVFRPFRYSQGLGTHHHNIRDYARGSRYRIALIRTQGVFCLVAHCVDEDFNDYMPEDDILDVLGLE